LTLTEVRSALAAPLSVGGRPIGVLAPAKRSTGRLATEEIEAFEVLALQGGLGFETVARRRAALEAVVL
jgi:GAF domain-containing protein